MRMQTFLPLRGMTKMRQQAGSLRYGVPHRLEAYAAEEFATFRKLCARFSQMSP
jgi:hypothetical protein